MAKISLNTCPDGVVYFLLNPAQNTIKIGYTNRLETRMRSLQCGNSSPLILLKIIPATPKYEKVLHRQFKELRQHGEWFMASSVLLTFIRGLEARQRVLAGFGV